MKQRDPSQPTVRPQIAVSAFSSRAELARLLQLRWLSVVAMALIALIAFPLLAPAQPVSPLLGVMLVLVAANFALLAGGVRAGAFPQLAVDLVAWATFLYFGGGVTNPAISLLLPLVAVGAAMLPAAQAWTLAALAVAIYSLLWHFHVPVQLADAHMAMRLHLAGMWLSFLLTAALVAAFAGHLAAALRRRDAELAEAREQRLRDEQLFALGLQAAAAAHDLATPMASVRLTLDELRRDYAGDDELERPLSVLSAQLARMETVLSRLAAAAQGRERTAGPPLPTEEWLRGVLERWGLMWPRARVELVLTEPLGDIGDDVALEAVLITLLNNAARVSPATLSLSASRDGDRLLLAVADRGPGLAAGAGQSGGWGVGLELAEATLARLGGRLRLEDAPGGGAVASVEWPLAAGGAVP